ncbi:MAG: hypothetical protein FWC84_07890 [Alphaproteobacteria bacterium]|nr:hypothetical protein [Alphaproteobacteria bacterium]
MLVASALVLAQEAKQGTRPPAGPKTDAEAQSGGKPKGTLIEKKNAAALLDQAKAAAVLRRQKVAGLAGNVDNQVEQFMRQARPFLRAELIFVRKVCSLDTEHFRKIYHDAEAGCKDAMTKSVEGMLGQRGLIARAARNAAEAPDPLTQFREALLAVMKRNLTEEQFARYQAEAEKRDAFQKQHAIAYLVEAIDNELFLSGEQRAKLTESLSNHWDSSWTSCAEYLLYGNRFFPAGLDPYVSLYLVSMQVKVWSGGQRVGRIGGVFGMPGPFANVSDDLLPELGETPKAGSPPNEPLQAEATGLKHFPPG